MQIKNDRNKSDGALLDSSDWEGILVGIDGYPNKNKDDFYFIGGGEDYYFKVAAIEFYGVKTKT